MKGLFMKDFLILKNQSKTLLMIFAIGIVMSLTFEPASLVFYIGMLGCLLALGTISYDEADHGYAFLFSLPINRKSYVIEKYLFILGSTVVFLAMSLVICGIMTVMGIYDRQNLLEELPSMLLALLMIIIVVCDITIPLRLKYGSEKSRIYLYLLSALCGVAGFVGSKLFPSMGAKFVAGIEQTPVILIVGVIIVFAIVSTFISVKVCEKIIAAKQF
ncbi:MAG: ABC-2 transporter permease [Erysipelotrichaceae bacterium]|nr:ABC-2 transporter permease [Erysipelotrichaceae bacterium]